MYQYILRRIGQTGIVVFGVSLIIFGLLHLSGDPVLLLVSSDAPPEMIEITRKELGLDRPIYEQFARYIGGVIRGDLGTSMRTNLPVRDLIFQRLPATIELTTAAVIIAAVLAIPAGIVSAVKRGTLIDQVAMLAALGGQAIPIFWLALLLILFFSVHLRWFPVYGHGTIWHLVLPAVSLSTIVAGRLARLVRSSMLEVLNQDYIRTARAKGLHEFHVLSRHALRNAAIPIVTLLGIQFARLLGGAVVTETIFAWPGVGRLVIEAIFNRDFPVVQGVVLIVSLIFVGVNLLVDLSYAVLNPRIRFEKK
ncbi:MAG: ABC transporter permease [Chloroflexota bacterium]